MEVNQVLKGSSLKHNRLSWLPACLVLSQMTEGCTNKKLIPVVKMLLLLLLFFWSIFFSKKKKTSHMSWINTNNKITKTNSYHRAITKIYNYISRNNTYNDDFCSEQCLVTLTSAIFTSMMFFLLLMKKRTESYIF